MPTKKPTRTLKTQQIVNTKTLPQVKQKTERADEVLVLQVDTLGGTKSPIKVPKAIFGNAVKSHTLTQALRVYQANLHQGTQSVKTRGEVAGSTRKIYRQKGTGKARHGSIKAPIFVGGGITFAPKPRNRGLELPQKMRRAMVLQTLLQKIESRMVTIVAGLETLSGKTKELVLLFTKMHIAGKRVLLLVDTKDTNAIRAARNIVFVSTRSVSIVSALDIVKHEQIILTPSAFNFLIKGKTKMKSKRENAL